MSIETYASDSEQIEGIALKIMFWTFVRQEGLSLILNAYQNFLNPGYSVLKTLIKLLFQKKGAKSIKSKDKNQQL